MNQISTRNRRNLHRSLSSTFLRSTRERKSYSASSHHLYEKCHSEVHHDIFHSQDISMVLTSTSKIETHEYKSMASNFFKGFIANRTKTRETAEENNNMRL